MCACLVFLLGEGAGEMGEGVSGMFGLIFNRNGTNRMFVMECNGM